MKELTVGIVFVLGMILIVYSVIFVSEVVVPGETHLLKIYFDNVDGLEPKSVVRFMGVDVGRVEEIKFDYFNYAGEEILKVKVLTRIQKKHLKYIKEDSEFFINTMGLVGKKYIEISAGSTCSIPIDFQQGIVGRNPFQIGRTLSRVEDIASGVDLIVKEGIGAASSVRLAAHQSAVLARQVRKSDAFATQLLRGDSQADKDMKRMMVKLDQVLIKLEKTIEVQYKLMTNKSLLDKIIGATQPRKTSKDKKKKP